MIIAAERSGFTGPARPLPPVAVPSGIIVAMGVAARAWNQEVGLSWTPSPALMLAGPILCLPAGWFYHCIRPALPLSEVVTNVGLWMAFPLFGTMLSYLCAALRYPLADVALPHTHRVLGFHWFARCLFVR